MKTLTDKIAGRLLISKAENEEVVLLLSYKNFIYLQNIYAGGTAINNSFTS